MRAAIGVSKQMSNCVRNLRRRDAFFFFFFASGVSGGGAGAAARSIRARVSRFSFPFSASSEAMAARGVWVPILEFRTQWAEIGPSLSLSFSFFLILTFFFHFRFFCGLHPATPALITRCQGCSGRLEWDSMARCRGQY